VNQAGKENDLIILFDGLCGLCSRLNRFILNRDVEGRFRFASLQSGFAKELLKRHERSQEELDTVYVVRGYATEQEELLMKSKAVFQILGELPGYKPWVSMARILPKKLTDFGYDLVAKNRYRFFERYEACPVPRPGERERFIQT
jgi:predicted DCC family thiol-disulfide oxidoreductase YuxK